MAIPMAAPTCWKACIAPDPAPASLPGTDCSTDWNSGEIVSPIPNPQMASGAISVAGVKVCGGWPVTWRSRIIPASMTVTPAAMRPDSHFVPKRPVT